jgi:hypothetical protein
MDDLMAEVRAALHLDVPCPTCGVAVSRPCLTPSGKSRTQVHVDRRGQSELLAMMDPLWGDGDG